MLNKSLHLWKNPTHYYCFVYVNQPTSHFRTFGFTRGVFAFQITYLPNISEVFSEFLLLQHWRQPIVLKQPEVQLTTLVTSLFQSVMTVFKVKIYDWGILCLVNVYGRLRVLLVNHETSWYCLWCNIFGLFVKLKKRKFNLCLLVNHVVAQLTCCANVLSGFHSGM